MKLFFVLKEKKGSKYEIAGIIQKNKVGRHLMCVEYVKRILTGF